MKKYRENLQLFIERIKSKKIIENEVAIGEFSPPIIEKLQQYNLTLETKKIYLSVNAYNHQLRTFKQNKGKSIPIDWVEEFYITLNSPYKVFLAPITPAWECIWELDIIFSCTSRMYSHRGRSGNEQNYFV